MTGPCPAPLVPARRCGSGLGARYRADPVCRCDGLGRRAGCDRRGLPAEREGLGIRGRREHRRPGRGRRHRSRRSPNDAATAHALTSDPVWRIVEMTPWIGPQLAAVSTVAEAADDVAANALTPLADVASTLSPMRSGRRAARSSCRGSSPCRTPLRSRPRRWRRRTTAIDEHQHGRARRAAARHRRRGVGDLRRHEECDRSPGERVRPAAGDARRRRPAQLPRAVPEQRRMALARRHRRRSSADPHRWRIDAARSAGLRRGLPFVRPVGAAARARRSRRSMARSRASSSTTSHRCPTSRCRDRSLARCGRASTGSRSTGCSRSIRSHCRTCSRQPAR